jgi:glycosyltransferase involved in cell wall biosynthesis
VSEGRISVVIPAYNRARLIGDAIRSVLDQDHPVHEIVVVDDGSTDGSPALAERCLRDAPFPHRLLAQANRGAPAAINEGLRLASGEFVNLLNSDDAFEPERIERMVAAVAGTGSAWGFSAIRIVDDRGAPADPLADRRAYDLLCSVGGIPHRESVAVSSGNLFVSRRLAASLRGFRDYRYNHDWDFCLRAMREAEPVFVAEPLYRYRLHGANTIAQSPQGARAEAAVVCRDYLQWAATETAPANPVAPTVATWGTLFVNEILREGMGELIDPDALRHLARTGTLPQPVAAS